MARAADTYREPVIIQGRNRKNCPYLMIRRYLIRKFDSVSA
jgi:hypothetical protein